MYYVKFVKEILKCIGWDIVVVSDIDVLNVIVYKIIERLLWLFFFFYLEE